MSFRVDALLAALFPYVTCLLILLLLLLGIFDEVPWFQTHSVFCPIAKKWLEKPCGNLCRTGGTTFEVWPKQTKERTLQRIAEEPEFAVSFQQVRKGVGIAEAKADKDLLNIIANVGPPTTVSSCNSSGITIEHKMALVEEAVYRNHMGCGPGDAGCNAELVRFPFLLRENNTGVLMQIPEFEKKGMPFETVSQWTTAERSLESVLLRPSNVFRKGQGSDRYRYALDTMLAALPRELRYVPGQCRTYDEHVADSREVERLKELANQAQAEAGAAAGSVARQSASTLDDDLGDFAVAPEPKAAKAKLGPRTLARAKAPAAPTGGSSRRPAPSRASSPSVAPCIPGLMAGGRGPATPQSSCRVAVDLDDRNGELDIATILAGGQMGRQMKKAMSL